MALRRVFNMSSVGCVFLLLILGFVGIVYYSIRTGKFSNTISGPQYSTATPAPPTCWFCPGADLFNDLPGGIPQAPPNGRPSSPSGRQPQAVPTRMPLPPAQQATPQRQGPLPPQIRFTPTPTPRGGLSFPSIPFPSLPGLPGLPGRPTQAPSTQPRQGPSQGEKVYAAIRLNLRPQANTCGKPLTTLPAGAELSVVGQNGPWLEVDAADQHGWVFEPYTVKTKAEISENRGRPRIPTPPCDNDEHSPPGGRHVPPQSQMPEATCPEGRVIIRLQKATAEYDLDSAGYANFLSRYCVDGYIGIRLMVSRSGNTSMTSPDRIKIDCHPINIVDRNRPNPPGNGKGGEEFCSAVALHEAYHMIMATKTGDGGEEADADQFANAALADRANWFVHAK